MRVERFDNLNDLEPYRGAWDRLADGVVFRGWTWLSTWWRHYGEGRAERSLEVFLAFDGDDASPDAVRAILPAYLESTWTQGRVLRLLGDGEVCSDHLGLLAAGSAYAEACATIARATLMNPAMLAPLT